MSRNYELLTRTGGTIEPASRRTAPLTRPEPEIASSPGIPIKHRDEGEFDLHAILHILLRRRRWIFACTASMLLLAALVCIFMPRQYKAESRVEILKQDTSKTWVGGDAASGSSDPLDFNLNLQTQLAVLKSDRLAWQVTKELKLVAAKDLPPEIAQPAGAASTVGTEFTPNTRTAALLKNFKNHLAVDSVPGTRLIRVTFRDSDPKRAARIVNQLVSDFVEYNFQVRFNATTKATEWLKGQLVDLKAQIEKSQERAVQLEKESGIFGEDEHHNIVLTRLEELNKELTSAETERGFKETVYKLSRGGDPELVANLLGTQPDRAGNSPANPAMLLNNLRQQEAALQAEYADASTKYGPAYPRLIQMKEKLDSVRSSIATESSKVSQRAEREYQLAMSREANARKSFTEQKDIASKMNEKATDYLIAKQEADSGRALYQQLLAKLKEAGVLAGLHSSELHVVDLAEVPVRPARPDVPLYLLIGALSGVVLGLVSAFIVEATDRTLRDVADIETTAFVPILGVIPHVELSAGEAKHHLLGDADSLSGARSRLIESLQNPSIAEACRAVRTSLLLSRPEMPAKIFLVTSAMAREGKSFSCWNLAAAFAGKGSRVLLVDGDLRRGSLSKLLLGQSSTFGLSQVLLGQLKPDATYRPLHEVPGLTFMPAGGCGTTQSELLESPQMESLIQQWRQQFDYVVLDTPPVLPVTDAVALSPSVDAVIVVVRYASTSRDAVIRTIHMLRNVRAPRVSVLVNSIDVRSPEYYRYSGSYGDDPYYREHSSERDSSSSLLSRVASRGE